MGLFNTRDRNVRQQIEVIKAHLRSCGFKDVDDPPHRQSLAFERDLHRIFAGSLSGAPRELIVPYEWMSDRDPSDVQRWLDDHAADLAELLRDGAGALRVITITKGGLHGEMEYPA